MSRLPFLSVIPKDTQEKQLKKTPRQIRAIKCWHKDRARKKKFRELRSKKNRAFEKLIEGRWYALVKLYNWRLRAALHEQYAQSSWAKKNNEFLISLEFWLRIWQEVYERYGFSYKDRGLGRDDELKSRSKWASKRRKSFNSLKFGRMDSSIPFQEGNICIYMPLRKKDVEYVSEHGIQTNAGLIVPVNNSTPKIVRKPHARLVLLEF